MDLNECAGEELKQAEARLAALLKKLGVDSNSPEEQAWEAYRDAQLKAIYPPVNDERAEYGSVYPMCWAILKKKLTESRIRDLKSADVCRGYDAWFSVIASKAPVIQSSPPFRVDVEQTLRILAVFPLCVVTSPVSSVKS